MDDLTVFVRARLDEDEAAAMAAGDAAMASYWLLSAPSADAAYAAFRAHVARHDPARVLREVEAKRRILADVKALIDGMDAETNQDRGPDHYYTSTGESDLLLKLLGLPYGDHPDYRPEWKP